MKTAPVILSEAKQLLAEAACWRLIGLLLERPRGGWSEEVRALAAEVEDELLCEAAETSRDATEGAYLDLFAEGGFVSPRETTWRHREDPGHILADIAGFHEALAFEPRAEDPIDHIAVEASFVGYLLLKEAYAVARGHQESAEITATARRRFIEAHLGEFAEGLAERVALSGIPYLIDTVAALARRVTATRADSA